jgi:hypothetical protein
MGSGNFIVIKPLWGLANRLLAIASAIKLAQILNRELKICWIQNEFHLNAKFEDLFKKIPFKFIQEDEIKSDKIKEWPFNYGSSYSDIQRNSIPEESFCLEHCHMFFLKEDSERNLKKELQYFSPLLEIQDRIDYFLNRYNFKEFIGVHIRKGDKVTVENKSGLSTQDLIEAIDKKYIDAMRKIKSEDNGSRFFMSSDADIKIFKEIFGDCVIEQTGKNIDRSSGLSDAVVDLWLLSNTKRVIRGAGTFAMCACMMKDLPSTNIFSGKECSWSVPGSFVHYGHFE